MTEENQEQTTEKTIRIGDEPTFADFPEDFLAQKGLSKDSKMTRSDYVALMTECNKLRGKQGAYGTQEVGLADAGSSEQSIQVDQKEDWVSKYDEKMQKYAEEKGQEWQRSTKDENGNAIEGLKGRIGDAEIHFTSPERATVNVAGIDILVHMASENGQDIKFNDKWTDEFKAKMIEACEKEGVKLTGRPEEQTTQTQQQEQETTPQAKSEPKYKVVPLFYNNRLDQFDREMTGNESIEIAREHIASKEEEIKEGKYNHSESVQDKTTAELLMKKYVFSQKIQDEAMAQACETALQRYGVEKIGKNKLGQYEITAGRTYDERSPEDKANIDKAFQKALPKLHNQDKQNNQVAQPKDRGNEGR